MLESNRRREFTINMNRIEQTAQARFAIEDIVFRYAEGIDNGDLEALGALFFAGTVVLPDREKLTGTREVIERYSELVLFYDKDDNVVPYERGKCTPRTKHLISNLIYEFDATVHTANVRSYFTVYQTLGRNIEIIAGGRYLDRFARTIQGWHIVERVLEMDHVGDTSRHSRTPDAQAKTER